MVVSTQRPQKIRRGRIRENKSSSGLFVQSRSSAASYSRSKPSAHFHHLHLNTTDPSGAIKFYTSKFDCEQRRFLDEDAVWALSRLQAEGVKILEPVKTKHGFKYTFIEGPDHIRIELLEK
jgi:hypothetical protein